MTELTPVMTASEIEHFLDTQFSEVHVDGRVFSVVDVSPAKTTLRLDPIARHLRPGGTVSGPTLFALADVCAYLVILAHIGPMKHTVTTNLNINFMHKPKPGPLNCVSTLLKLGKRLAVVNCDILDENKTIVAQATATYSIPSK
ncbi:PaaI family thioesterase [Ahrensia kielensis]|uniref:PaaI family thioesterase n=1 Tax=Ahrensia kielensis TaxID=76980 RepID=UPI00037017F7|nr:PaaI family thioesterase [Ahrensia kielensis]